MKFCVEVMPEVTIFCTFLHSVIPKRLLLKVVRLNDDAITHDPLRMRTTNLTQSNLTGSQAMSVGSRLITRE
jgi:hypothetical protein